MDTIVACATPWGRSALALVRLSGPEARPIAESLSPGGPRWVARRASLRHLRKDGSFLDEVMAVWMPGPRSFTGEDTVELSCHGNPVVVEAVLDACVAAGARPARPGEFTRRAFVNGRMDLLQVEALDALIHATSPEGVRIARAGFDGSLSREAIELRQALLELAAELEARLDHPGEDLGYQADAAVAEGLADVARRADALAATWRAGRLRVAGAKVALVGPVNSGKSSLFNHLVGEERALVSDEPGTTRDVVERSVLMGGIEVTFLDTAGERPEVGGLEARGQALGRRLTADVDLRLVVLPLHEAPEEAGEGQQRWFEGPHLVVGTHLDRVEWAAPIPAPLGSWFPDERVDVRISNRDGTGIADLRSLLARRLGAVPPGGLRAVLLSQRQHDLFGAVARHAAEAREALLGLLGPAVAAEAATRALERLAELTGEDVREGVLDALFSRFCVGK